MKITVILLGLLCALTISTFGQRYKVQIDTLHYPAEFHSLCAINNNLVWVCGSEGTVGKTTNGGKTWIFFKIQDGYHRELRDIVAWDPYNAVVLNVKDPAEIFKTSNGGITWDVVYKAPNNKISLDGFAFWNKKRGIAYGDPIKGRFLILYTEDGGATWKELDWENSPLANQKEVGFPGSGTDIHVRRNGKVWFGTGGHDAEIFYSTDYGLTWEHHETPLAHGEPSQGVNSIVFKNDKYGVIVGGDFTAPELAEDNYSITTDGGISWIIPTYKQKHPSGYRDCIEYIGGNSFVTLGNSGIDISTDGGFNWENISHDAYITVEKAHSGNAIFIAGKGVIGRLVKSKR